MIVLVRFLGGYDHPVWWIDRRPQPLRSRRVVQRVWTILRRNIVTRLKVSGKSYRAIGRELGVSHVAAWKLWHQVVDDHCAQALAESAGWKRLRDARTCLDVGDSSEFRILWSEAARRFGVRRTTRLLGRPD
jgi:DNA-binding CsgD family transcriptional regulator